MIECSRIPKLESADFDGALFWFSELQVKGLMFHPDDDPEDIVRISNGEQFFSDEEVREVRGVMARLFDELHDDVYAAAYPIVMNAFGNRLDA